MTNKQCMENNSIIILPFRCTSLSGHFFRTMQVLLGEYWFLGHGWWMMMAFVKKMKNCHRYWPSLVTNDGWFINVGWLVMAVGWWWLLTMMFVNHVGWLEEFNYHDFWWIVMLNHASLICLIDNHGSYMIFMIYQLDDGWQQ